MTTNKWFLMGLTVVCAVAAFALDLVLWPNPVGAMMPDSSQMPFLIAVYVIEAIAFGVGVSFLVSMWGFLKGHEAFDRLTVFAVTWLLVSWWPHDNMHRVNAMNDFWGLIRIEWMFHFTLIVAGIIVASYVWKNISGWK